MLDAREGWRRFIGHFILFAAPPLAVGFILQQNGWWIPTWAQWISLAGVAAIIVPMELRSTRRLKQTVGKMMVDLSAKLGGTALGLLGANWWHPIR